jgi:hypothetical protein
MMDRLIAVQSILENGIAVLTWSRRSIRETDYCVKQKKCVMWFERVGKRRLFNRRSK